MDDTPESLLIRIDERTAHMAEDMKEWRSEYRLGFKDHEDRLRSLEETRSKTTGFWQGANWLKGVLTAIPAGVLGWFVAHR